MPWRAAGLNGKTSSIRAQPTRTRSSAIAAGDQRRTAAHVADSSTLACIEHELPVIIPKIRWRPAACFVPSVTILWGALWSDQIDHAGIDRDARPLRWQRLRSEATESGVRGFKCSRTPRIAVALWMGLPASGGAADGSSTPRPGRKDRSRAMTPRFVPGPLNELDENPCRTRRTWQWQDARQRPEHARRRGACLTVAMRRSRRTRTPEESVTMKRLLGCAHVVGRGVAGADALKVGMMTTSGRHRGRHRHAISCLSRKHPERQAGAYPPVITADDAQNRHRKPGSPARSRKDRVDIATRRGVLQHHAGGCAGLHRLETFYISASAGPSQLTGEAAAYISTLPWQTTTCTKAMGGVAGTRASRASSLRCPTPGRRDARGFGASAARATSPTRSQRLGQLDYSAGIAQIRAAGPMPVHLPSPAAIGINCIKQMPGRDDEEGTDLRPDSRVAKTWSSRGAGHGRCLTPPTGIADGQPANKRASSPTSRG